MAEMEATLAAMEASMEVRELAAATRSAYLGAVRRFGEHHGKDPAELGRAQVEAFLLHLKQERGLVASTRNQYAAALRFLYGKTLEKPEVAAAVVKALEDKKLPEVLSGTEVRQLLGELRKPVHHALGSLCYGAGLRVGEACRLEAKDVDSKRMVIHVHHGKGRKDRQVPLSRRLLAVLRRYYGVVRPRPPYLFPGRSGRGHLSKAAFQKALQHALRKTGITKRVTPHVLRHSYATHLIEAGADLRSVQLLLGHSSLRSTTTYVHLTRSRFDALPSPLDMLGTKEGEGLG